MHGTFQQWRAAACLAALSIIAAFAHGAEIHVPRDYAGIQAAIDFSVDGDEIIVAPGIYLEWIDFLGKAITVRSTDPDDHSVVAATIIDGQQAGRCVAFRNEETASSVLSGFTITNGRTWGQVTNEDSGAAILCLSSSPTITNNIVFGNVSDMGGAVFCRASAATFLANELGGNSPTGIYCRESSTTFHGNRFVDSCLDARLGLSDIFIDNEFIGSWIRAAARAVVVGNSFAGWFGAWPPVRIQPRIFSENHVVFSRNSVTANCKGIQWSSEGIISDCVISGNYGCGIVIDGRPPVVCNNAIVGNKGGGIANISSSRGSIIRNTIAFNEALEHTGGMGGGIIALYGLMETMRIENNTIVGNSAMGESGHMAEGAGGGIYIFNEGTIIGNLIAGNIAGWGGGVLLSSTTPAKIRFADNTVVGNTALQAGGGMNIFGHSDSYGTNLKNSILLANQAPLGREIAFFAQTTVSHCDVDSSEAGIYTRSPFLITWLTGNIDADPQFVDPGHWDGDTFIPGDYHLLPGSPCIDAGTNYDDNRFNPRIEIHPDTDITGIPRTIDGNLDGVATIDIGAYEYLPGDVNYDGKVNVLDLLIVRNSMGRDPASSIDARKADVNADGAVNVQDLLIVRGRLGK